MYFLSLTIRGPKTQSSSDLFKDRPHQRSNFINEETSPEKLRASLRAFSGKNGKEREVQR